MSAKLKAPPLPEGPIDMFIGILSAGNHFAERMAVRKSWMQHNLIKSTHVVARFFVSLVHTASAKYIMKCDDDTFVRVDAVINEANKIVDGKSLHVGNINYYYKPLRYGKCLLHMRSLAGSGSRHTKKGVLANTYNQVYYYSGFEPN